MKRVKFLYKTLPLLFTVFCLNACDDNEIQDIPKVQEKLELTASSIDITLDENNLTDDIITFDWTEARAVPGDDYVVSYTTKLDLVGNNFGTSTAILTYEDDGVFSKSFTSEQLNNWAKEKWKTRVNQPFTLEFRVVAQWEGGSEFEAPEVRTIRVNVQPIKVEVFAADKMFVAGSATQSGDPIQMTKTLENESQYAWLGNLVAGDLQIPVELEGYTYYIVPKTGDGTVQDGVGETVKMQEAPVSWHIETPGEYRVVVNMKNSTITIYSPEKALKPAVVTWPLDGVTQTTTVTKLWRYGSDGWAWKEINFVPSVADPQILVYSGAAISGRTKFGVAAVNVSYVYTGNKTGVDTSVAAATTYDLVSGYGGSGSDNPRNSYFSIPSGINFIVVDIRNMKIFFDKH
ncbi:conserved exported hypothetical protein [uncultured Dysgonomonas sp.]|uniref:SusE outer membrane protein domain-containing protein n=1 Tax=uncultured Dysgonomonas sp. TaxID=206096 RepID=A0A212JQJ0_9BACT|nr:SusE domain-containing protein [uncultured Dysgonomonas sp.]SBW01680.1 conserved exported hypothetical protein [uncultured Dysgonomonas sp.]